MNRLIQTLTFAVLAAPALADPGHLAGIAGHDHWVAGAAIGLAIGLGVWSAVKGRGKPLPENDAAKSGGTSEPEAMADPA